MDDNILLLKNAVDILPEMVFLENICRRIHERQMEFVLDDLMYAVERMASRQIVVECDILQTAYQYNFRDKIDEIRYNLIYYDLVENWDYDDVKSCAYNVGRWNEEFDEYFNVFPDLPHLINDEEYHELFAEILVD